MTRHRLLLLALATVFSVSVSASGAADGDKKPAKELKVIAQTNAGLPGQQPKGLKPVPPQGPLPANVIRTAEELVAATSLKDKAKDEATQKEVSESIAKTLKVAKIDWNSQMLVVIDEGEGINRTLTVGPFKIQDKSLSVTYNINTRQGGAALRTQCRALLLVERWNGDVKFTRTFSRSGDPRAP
jgi:hypothetical protein